MATRKPAGDIVVHEREERRIVPAAIEYRESDADASISGMAAVFNQETVIAGLFREQIAPGAFADAIRGGDTVALFNHDSNYPLGRQSNGTLRLKEDRAGLRYEVDLDGDDPDAQRVRAKIKRGTVKGSSFGFTVEEDEWDDSEVKRGKLPLRTITRVGELFDVSPVTFPAYPQTSVSARSRGEAYADAVKTAQAQAEQQAREAEWAAIEATLAERDAWQA